MQYKQIKSLDELRIAAIQDSGANITLSLKGFKSSKHVRYFHNKSKPWYVFNLIDDTELTGTDETINNEHVCLIGKAIETGAAYLEIAETV